jgi:hypothetical protein
VIGKVADRTTLLPSESRAELVQRTLEFGAALDHLPLMLVLGGIGNRMPDGRRQHDACLVEIPADMLLFRRAEVA